MGSRCAVFELEFALMVRFAMAFIVYSSGGNSFQLAKPVKLNPSGGWSDWHTVGVAVGLDLDAVHPVAEVGRRLELEGATNSTADQNAGHVICANRRS